MKNLTQLIKGILTPAIQEVAKDIYKLSTKVNEAILKNLAQIKSADHITLATNIKLDPDVNQCQGFTYNFKKNTFILACVNSDNTKQVIYELSPTDFSVLTKRSFTGADILGHCNTLTYDGTHILVTNGATNGNRIYRLNDDLTVDGYTDYTDKFFNIDYNKGSKKLLSIVPGDTNATRKLRLYDYANLNAVEKEVTVTVNETNNDSNGALLMDRTIVFATLNRIVESDYAGTILREVEINSSIEIEDFAYANSMIYMASNEGGKVNIYVHDPVKSAYEHINDNHFKNGIFLPNQQYLYGKSPDNKWIPIAKVNKNGNVEMGSKDKPMALCTNALTVYDGTNSNTVITTAHYGTAIYSKNQVDTKLNDYVTTKALEKKLENVGGAAPDLSAYATKKEVQDVMAKINELLEKTRGAN